jgi:hypothetical protein
LRRRCKEVWNWAILCCSLFCFVVLHSPMCNLVRSGLIDTFHSTCNYLSEWMLFAAYII